MLGSANNPENVTPSVDKIAIQCNYRLENIKSESKWTRLNKIGEIKLKGLHISSETFNFNDRCDLMLSPSQNVYNYSLK